MPPAMPKSNASRLLRAMRDAGYRVDGLPGTADELRERVTGGNAARFGALARIPGLGASRIARFGEDLLAIVRRYGGVPLRRFCS